MDLTSRLPTFSQESPKPSLPPPTSMSGMYPSLANVRSIIAVSSGKGGVGKSTVSVNLAIALARMGAKVGLMDADVYGPSVPKMLAGYEQPNARDNKIIPIIRYGVEFMSMGVLTNSDTPVIWRGPMATKLIQQFLGGVEWGDLEYLIIDLPPGTGDVQLTLTQSTPLSGAIVVTTPQEVAVDVATRGIRMFEEVKVPILGIVENMSGFVCPHCHEKTDIFKMGGGREAARVLGIPFLGGVPIDPEAAVAGDRGEPVVAVEKHPRPASAIALDEVARALKNQIEHVQAQLDPMTTLNEVACDENGLILRWANRKTRLDFRKARLACPCAECVDENTGRVKLEEHLVPKDVRPFRFHPVGRYGLQIAWSDGHSTGIYTYRHLSELSN